MEKIFKTLKRDDYRVIGENIEKSYKNALELIEDSIKKGNVIDLISPVDSSILKLENHDNLIEYKKAFYGHLFTTEFMD